MTSLDTIYARVPRIRCKGKCQQACGPIAMTAAEFSRLAAAAGREPSCGPDLACSLLDARGRCSGYEARPLICRLWGVVKRMRCPHGCEPERWLSEDEAAELLRQANEVGGPTRLTIGGMSMDAMLTLAQEYQACSTR